MTSDFCVAETMTCENSEDPIDDGEAVPGFLTEVGTRLALTMSQIGMDTSVRVTGKSAKQLRRYAIGHEPPITVVKALADASGASLAYLIDGIVQTGVDAELKRRLIDNRLANIRSKMDQTDDPDELKHCMAEEQSLLRTSQFFLKLGAALLNVPKYPSYTEILDSPPPVREGPMDPRVVLEIRKSMGLPTETSEQSGSGEMPGYVLVPRYDVSASAGPGLLADSEQVVDHLAFREDWVRRSLGADPRRLVLITAAGESMEPTIRSGDLLLIDTSIDRVVDNAIYVVVYAGHLVVKRVQRFFNGAVTIKSDNPAYVEETLGPDDALSLIVAGRVRWIARII